ncbi:mitochondrial carrier [Mytilinidion resinicola]|uniref:Mitochondrial carrier n=1 Tax=Mytilinidion resinicola TaxID=574789 RepID=A0A6A6Z548_9PEZI|nr:mitochondrial carrier [Mytilinidion resinicola]KAF2816206.1 mitochondrial carrier [Mytilinidion resinicola]
MATSRDAPNPLRPYYRPPSIGLAPDSAANGTASHHASSFSRPSFESKARDILSDLDYGDYMSDGSPSVADMAKRLVDQALWDYTTVFLGQPLEVAKTILQVHQAAGQAPPGITVNTDDVKSRPNSYASGKYEDYPSDEDDSDADSPSYFTSTAPNVRSFSPTAQRSPERRRHAPSRSNSSTPTPSSTKPPHKLELRRPDSLLEVLAQLWQKESAWGVWKATNMTFVYNFLLKTSESWTRSLLSALLNVPDPGLVSGAALGLGSLDIVDSPNPLASLAVAVAAAAIAGLALAPLDLIRTRLIVTPTSSTPRNIYPSVRSLPSLTIPNALLPITLLHSSLPVLFSTSAPLVLRSSLGIDSVLTPATHALSSFLSSAAELFLRLPLETVLRRGQVAVLQESDTKRLSEAYRTLRANPGSDDSATTRNFKTIVDVGPYKGVLGTMWFIVREEGITFVGPGGAAVAAASVPNTPGLGFAARARVRKGQGMQGLWRGWRVGFWGLVGVWGVSALGGAGGGEF